MAKFLCRYGAVLWTVAFACSGAARGQTQPSDSSVAVPFILHPDESRTVEVLGTPGSLQVVEIRLEGGLVWLQSPQTSRRLLDLGKGGHLRYVVEIASTGTGKLELRSAEHLRDANLTLQLAANTGREKASHLEAAEIAFALADTARRHQAGAPTVTDALAEYDHAAAEAQQAGDLSLLDWILNQKARFLLYQKSSFVVPHEILERAATLAVDDPAVQALTYKTLSSCEYFMGHLDAAVAAAERALTLYKQTGDLYWQDVVLGNLIADYSEMGRNEDATRAGREALADAEQVQDTAGVVYCLTELANLYRLEGNPQAAFQAFREAELWSQNIRYAPLIQADIERALGSFYLDMGLWDEAQRQFEESLKRASPDSEAALDAQALLAQTLAHDGNPAHALQEYASAIAIAGKLKLTPEETALRIERSAILLTLHRTQQAHQDAEESLRSADALKDPRLQIAATLAEAAADAQTCELTHHCGDAEQMYHHAIALIGHADDREQETIAYAGLARVSEEEGRNESALQSIEHALTLVEQSRASLSSNMLAASYFNEWRNWYPLAERISLKLDLLHPGRGYREIAFRYSERARARAMLDAIGEPQQASATSFSPEIQRKLELNERAIQSDQAKLLATGSQPAADALEHLYLEQDQIAASSVPGRSQALANNPPIPALADLQHEFLRPTDAILSFAVGPDRSNRWLITSSAVQVKEIPGGKQLSGRLKTLENMLLSRRPAPLPGEDATQYARRVSTFDEQMDLALESAGTLLLSGLPVNVRHLYVIADGDLSSLPWSALRIPCAARTCYAIQRFAISMEPSASVAFALASRPTETARTGILLVSEGLPLQLSSGPHWAALTALPGSRREVEAIAQLAPSDTAHVLDGRQATLQNLRLGLQEDPAVLHLATHTFLVPGHPELSGIALSPDAGSQSNAVLWLHDIPSLHAPPLVTLSGCATQGDSLDGEDLKTLTQVFFYAGSQQVVASLWSVDDNATATLMEDFYRSLLRHRMDAADGLRAAQLRMISRHADLSSWAAFVVDGVATKGTLTESARN
jgi:tetratricopeptide (TPR) repeat protein